VQLLLVHYLLLQLFHMCAQQSMHHNLRQKPLPTLCLIMPHCLIYAWTHVLTSGSTSEATSQVPPDRNTRAKLQSQGAAAASTRAATDTCCQLPVEAVGVIAAMIGFPWLVPGWHPELRRSSSNSSSSGSSSRYHSYSNTDGHNKAGAYVLQCMPMHAAVFKYCI
jgi:hypothetical protein